MSVVSEPVRRAAHAAGDRTVGRGASGAAAELPQPLRFLRAVLRRATGWQPPAPPPPRLSYCYMGGDRALALTRRGDMIYLDTSDIGITPHIALHGTWEDGVEAALARLLRPGDRVIEVGANMGYHTIGMAKTIGPAGVLHAFEVNARVLPLLRDSITLNGLDGVVTIHPFAALDQDGIVEFAADPRHIGSGHWVPGMAAENYSDRFVVQAVSLDAHLPDTLGPIDLLRMDAEGSEPEVMRGAAGLIGASPRLTIVTEWAPSMMGPAKDVAGLVAWLDRMGFRFWQIGEDGALREVPRAALTTMAHCDLVISRQAPPPLPGT